MLQHACLCAFLLLGALGWLQYVGLWRATVAWHLQQVGDASTAAAIGALDGVPRPPRVESLGGGAEPWTMREDSPSIREKDNESAEAEPAAQADLRPPVSAAVEAPGATDAVDAVDAVDSADFVDSADSTEAAELAAGSPIEAGGGDEGVVLIASDVDGAASQGAGGPVGPPGGTAALGPSGDDQEADATALRDTLF